MAKAPNKAPAKPSAVKRPTAFQATAAQVAAQSVTTGSTVTVACKLPNGLNLGPIHGEDKPHVILRGTNHPLSIGGYGLTPGIDRDAFAKWMEDHKWMDAVKNDLIFANESGRSVREMAADRARVESGLEPLNGDDPSADPRVQDFVEPTDEQKAVLAKAREEGAEELEEFRESGEEA